MDKMREEFEAWVNSFLDDEKDTLGLYDAWQASRKALVVELPQPNSDGEDSLMRRVEIALGNAGVNY